MPVVAENQQKSAELSIDPEIKALFEAGAHIGYSKARRHPKMQSFIFGTRNNIEIIDLDQTLERLKAAEEFMREMGRGGKIVMWVGTKAPAKKAVKSAGERLKMPYVSERWLGGTLTNFRVLEARLKYWADLERQSKSAEFEKYSKKERLVKTIELGKLERMFGGLRAMSAPPGALVIIDSAEEKTALSEARRKKIPVVAMLNVDCNPEWIERVIPANDNASAAISLVLERLVSAYESGFKEKQANLTNKD